MGQPKELQKNEMTASTSSNLLLRLFCGVLIYYFIMSGMFLIVYLTYSKTLVPLGWLILPIYLLMQYNLMAWVLLVVSLILGLLCFDVKADSE